MEWKKKGENPDNLYDTSSITQGEFHCAWTTHARRVGNSHFNTPGGRVPHPPHTLVLLWAQHYPRENKFHTISLEFTQYRCFLPLLSCTVSDKNWFWMGLQRGYPQQCVSPSQAHCSPKLRRQKSGHMTWPHTHQYLQKNISQTSFSSDNFEWQNTLFLG